MAVLKCKMCGGDLNIVEGETVAVCEYCDTKQTVPTADNEKKMTLFARANRLRAACEFDKAAGIYENIVADFPEEAEAFWGLVLCKFGIEYVDDPATGKKIPTCHRSSFDSVLDDEDFEQVMENADSVARKVYREEAKQIEEIRKGIIEVSSKEEPYDVFICYKETDENGERTIDSVIAQDIYDMLTENKYRVFFARISLEDKLGTAYEPYIFAALNSARIMLAIGTDYDYYNAVWVKNEWSRFLMLMSKDKKKMLIPCYKNLDAYDIPKEFRRLQAQDMGKIGAMQDLLRGVKKILPKEKQPVVVQQNFDVTASSENSKINSLLKRVYIFLEDEDWDSANRYCEKILDIDPENGEAYFCKLMAKCRITEREKLKTLDSSFENDNDYKKAVRFGDDNLKYELNSYIEYIGKKQLYNKSVIIMNKSHNVEQLLEAKANFESIDFRDSADKAKKCDEIYQREMRILADDKKRLEELNQVFANLEIKIKEWEKKHSELNNFHYNSNEVVPAENELNKAQQEMKQLSQQLRDLKPFKKKEKGKLSLRIVELGKQLSKLKELTEIQKRERLEAYRNSMSEAEEEENNLIQIIQQEKRVLYLEANERKQQKMFESACKIYTFLGDYVDCEKQLADAQQEEEVYRSKID